MEYNGCTAQHVRYEAIVKVAVLGGGAGGAASVAELVSAGHEVRFWSRSRETLAPFQEQAGVAFDGIMGCGRVRPRLMTSDLAEAADGADLVLICVPTFAHGDVVRALARNRSRAPIVLNPGHTGGALEVRQTFISSECEPPPIAEFSTLTYVARKYTPASVTITGKAGSVRLAALPGGKTAAKLARILFPGARPVSDVLACDLANVNMVLHVPGAILGAAWVEATEGAFTFYVQGMTPGVARVMRALDDERRAVARAFNHELPSLTAEMQAIGTVEQSAPDIDDFVAAISSGDANRRIKAPNSLRHRYYEEDLCYGLLPFTVFAKIAGVDAPVAKSLLNIGQVLVGFDPASTGRTAERMGIADLDRSGLLRLIGADPDGR
jgi:opine dehydrogenase